MSRRRRSPRARQNRTQQSQRTEQPQQPQAAEAPAATKALPATLRTTPVHSPRRRPPRAQQWPRVASAVIAWNPAMPLPKSWPYPTSVVEVLPGEAIQKIAANGGFSTFVASRWGVGHWVVQEVSNEAKILSTTEVTVPRRWETPGAQDSASDPKLAPSIPDPSQRDRVSDREWATCWAASSIQDFMRSNPHDDILGIFREVVEALIKDADLIRTQSLEVMLRLTDSVIHQVTKGRVGRGRRLTRRPLPNLGR